MGNVQKSHLHENVVMNTENTNDPFSQHSWQAHTKKSLYLFTIEEINLPNTDSWLLLELRKLSPDRQHHYAMWLF